MTSARVSRLHRGLIAALVTVYLGAGIAGFFLDFDDSRSRVLWIALLLGGAILMVVGAVLRAAPPRLSAMLVSVGAIGGGLPLLGTILVPLAAAALAALSFSLARQSQPA